MAILAMNQQSLIFSTRTIKLSLFICLLIHLINCNLLMLAALHPKGGIWDRDNKKYSK